ncbi:acyltransferase [Agromyces aurantiacus]|uniref:Acyltransferase n=1 Tax=Agromyces aurantiacus TaxID=165814 RepID=A0ABV9R3D9_9MICO|nr:acyltransferase [Agromyces aurantiacus]MBM7502639.1 peptidoglycan/LPS O-acetylase OafA/YrhL [Agromyces aurantiacus]
MVARTPSLTGWTTDRKTYLDNLKVVLIATIIAIHGVLGYVGSDQYWTYADVQETALQPVTELVLAVLVVPFGLFMIALLFLVAGLLTPPSFRRKGARRFVGDRLLRLGVPFAVVTFVLWPMLTYALYHPLGAAPGSFWEEYLSDEGNIDTSILWFVGVLLIFSIGYAGGVLILGRFGPRHPSPRRVDAIRLRHLALLAAATAAATFLVRLAFPYGSESATDLNLWEWPGCLALFGLGIVACDRGWAAEAPPRLVRAAGVITAIAGVAAAGFLLVMLRADLTDAMWGGWSWPALVFVLIESPLMVFGSVWLLGVAQRRLARPVRGGDALARSAYAAFLVQGFVLIGLALLLRPVPLPAELKALLVSAGGVVGSFGIAWLLVSRVRWLARVL